MLIKLVLSTLIIGACTFIGYMYSYSYTQRFKELKALYSSIQQLETEIMFTSSRLVDALYRAGEYSKDSIGKVFIEISNLLSTKRGYTVEEAFKISIDKEGNNLFMLKDDIDIMYNLFLNLGYMDKEHQQTFFKSSYIELDQQKKEAYELAKQYGDMYRKIGALIGIAIVVIFI